MEFRSTEHPISWFRDRYLDASLEIRPPYQRNPVWADRQRSSLIETILMNLPIPEVFIQRTTTPEGVSTYALVDGQQRVRTVLQFIGVESDPEEVEHNKFSLDKLDSDSPWRNLSFDELEDEKKSGFFDYDISVRYLNTDNEFEVRDMFRRLNKYLTPLKPQELRNAIYIGPFIRLATRLADDEYWAVNRIITATSIRRMGDIEFVSELVIGAMHGPQDGSQKVIDSYYEQYEDYDLEFPGQRKARSLYKQTLETMQLIFPDIPDYRWGNKTDFYTLFTAIASFLRTKELVGERIELIRNRLIQFAKQVDARLSDEEASVPESAIEYVSAVEKGANAKQRRAKRHEIMKKMLRRYFKSKES